MTAFFTKIVSIIIAPVILISGLFTTPQPHYEVPPQIETTVGTIIPKAIALFETSLASKITPSATEMTLVNATDKDGNTLSSSTYGFIIDEGSSDEELVLANCTSTACTGMTRGISVVSGTSSVAALQKTHRRGASVKITSAPLTLILTRILNGQESLPNRLYYESHPCTAGSSSFSVCDKSYSDGLVNQGAATATEAVGGIAKLSLAATSTNNPVVVGTNDLRVSPVSLATLTAGQVGALASSTNPSATNRYLTANEATSTASTSMVAKYTATGQLTASTTPLLNSDATSKLYVDTLIFQSGSTTYSSVNNANGTTTITHGLGRLPKFVRIYAYYLGANTVTIASKSVGTWDGTHTTTMIDTVTSGTAVVNAFATTSIIAMVTGAPNANGATTATMAVSTTTLTLTWTGAAASAGNASLMWEAY